MSIGRTWSVILLVTLLLPSMFACTDKAQERVTAGDTFYDQGQWDSAISSYNDAIKINPSISINDKLSSAYMKRAGKYLQDGNLTAVTEDFEKLLKLDNSLDTKLKVADGYYQIGEGYYKENAYEKAVTAYSQAITLGLSGAQVWCSRGEAKVKCGQHHAAISDYNTALTMDPRLIDAINGLAYAYYKDGEYQKAFWTITPAIENRIANRDSYINRGLVSTAIGNFDQAVNDFTKAIQLDPQYPTAYHQRARVYCDKIDYQSAYADLNRVLQLKSANAHVALNDRAVINGKLGDLNSSLDDLDAAIKINPKYLICYFNRGMVYTKMNKPDEALRDFNIYLLSDIANEFGAVSMAQQWQGYNRTTILQSELASQYSSQNNSPIDDMPITRYQFADDIEATPLCFKETPGYSR